MKKLLTLLFATFPLMVVADEVNVSSPNGKLTVSISDEGGRATYSVSLDGQRVLNPSVLGFQADYADFTKNLTLKGTSRQRIDKAYQMRQVKCSQMHYVANQMNVDFVNAKGFQMTVQMNVSDNDIAFRYILPRPKKNNPKCAVIKQEMTAFNLPEQTSTFLCPQIDPWTGWERTKPSYEEEYTPDAPINVKSQFGQGYTFPCLFKTPSRNDNSLWVLISETGVDSHYCASHLSDYKAGKGYSIAFPQPKENNGVGSTDASFSLPGATPWRTITVGSTLKPIVETTVAYDVVEPRYAPSQDYLSGRYTWSWIIWQDESMNWDDQIAFIDLAGQMGYEYCLVDANWDTEIGRDRMPELTRYAKEKGVELLLWYNSNGSWNDAPQGPRDCMDTSVARDREMAWLKKIGVKGIKVDFFGGDKQETMRLYEDILTDANRYGLQVIFHGCTLPRGWERMYPNFVASEAVLASENVYFTEHHAQAEAFELTMHPFCRNAVASMDWGGVLLNKFMSRDNKSRHKRYTTDVFEIASAFTNQSAVQCVGIQPNNLQELPQTELEFLRQLPTTWDETRFIDGYPGKYVVMARRHAGQWYIAGLNALKEPLTLSLNLSDYQLSNLLIDVVDKKTKATVFSKQPLKVNKKGVAKVMLQPNGGVVIY